MILTVLLTIFWLGALAFDIKEYTNTRKELRKEYARITPIVIDIIFLVITLGNL